MKRKIHIVQLGITAFLSLLFSIFQNLFAGVFSTLMAFPFEQIGMVLRRLSLSSGVGNVAAIIIYFIVSLLPIAAIFVIMKKRKLYAEDGLLVLFSAVLFAVLYLIINPGILNSLIGGSAGSAVGNAVLGVTVYSVLCGYFVLRILRLFTDGSMEKLVQYMSITLCVLNILFVYMIFGANFSNMLDSITVLQVGNVGSEHLLGASYVFLVLRFIMDALPYIFNVAIVFAALRLLDEMRANRYSDGTVAAAQRVSRFCALALIATVLAIIVFNLLQLLFARPLMIINSSVQIPILSIVFVLAMLLLTRLITENKELKDDIDMFV